MFGRTQKPTSEKTWELDGFRHDIKNHPNHQQLIRTLAARKWEEANSIVRNDEIFSEITDSKGFLPLHISIKSGAPIDLIHSLLVAYPVSISIRDPEGFLPIHLTSKFHKESLNLKLLDTYILIVSAYPEGLLEKDPEGNLPLHLQVKFHAPDHLIMHTLTCEPRLIGIPDKLGNILLHLIIQFDCSKDIIFKIIKAFPDGVMARNNKGSLPLHKAALFDTPIEVIRELLDRYPQGAFETDKNGNLPLHLLYMNRSNAPDEAKLAMFLQVNPTGLSTMNNNNQTPIMMLYGYHESISEYYES